MLFTFKICQECNRRFLTDTAYKSHLSKHNSGNLDQGSSLVKTFEIELQTCSASSDQDVKAGPLQSGLPPLVTNAGREKVEPDANENRQESVEAVKDVSPLFTRAEDENKLSSEKCIQEKLMFQKLFEELKHLSCTINCDIDEATCKDLQDLTSISGVAHSGKNETNGRTRSKRTRKRQKRLASGSPGNDQQNDPGVVESADDPRLKCQSCNEMLAPGSLLAHHSGDCQGKVKPKCKFCGEAFDFAVRLAHHVRLKHKEQVSSRQPTCSLCKKNYKRISNLKSHIINDHGKDQLEHCDECKRTFCDKSRLEKHKKVTHQRIKVDQPKVKAFQCHLCPNNYSQKQGLKFHLSSFHEQLRPYKCKVCDASYAHPGSLTIHFRNKHDNQLSQAEQFNTSE